MNKKNNKKENKHQKHVDEIKDDVTKKDEEMIDEDLERIMNDNTELEVKSLLSPSTFIKCFATIKCSSSLAAVAGAGLAQIPGGDNIVITPIQITMIITLGKIFGLELEESTARLTLSNFLATKLGKGIAHSISAVIPGYGNVINATTAALITEFIGWQTVKSFINKSKTKNMK